MVRMNDKEKGNFLDAVREINEFVESSTITDKDGLKMAIKTLMDIYNGVYTGERGVY